MCIRDRFNYTDFQNSAVDDPAQIRVHWGWSTGDRWQTPGSPRLHFAGEPVLFKLYVSELWYPTGNASDDAGASELLMNDLLPAIQAAWKLNPQEAADVR